MLMKALPRPAPMPAKTTNRVPAKPRKAAAKATRKMPKAGGADWREATLEQMRKLILAADADMVEERKWRKASNAMAGIPVWSHGGLVCTGETYKDKVKFTFAKGAFLEDPTGLFNADDKGNTRRAIDLREGESVDAKAFKALVRAAVAANAEAKR